MIERRRTIRRKAPKRVERTPLPTPTLGFLYAAYNPTVNVRCNEAAWPEVFRFVPLCGPPFPLESGSLGISGPTQARQNDAAVSSQAEILGRIREARILGRRREDCNRRMSKAKGKVDAVFKCFGMCDTRWYVVEGGVSQDRF